MSGTDATGSGTNRPATPVPGTVRRLESPSAAAVAELAATLEQVYEKVIEHGTLPRPDDHP